MAKRVYDIELKMQVVRKYRRGKCGYKKLAKEFALSRDTVRSWCLNQRLLDAIQAREEEAQNGAGGGR